MQRRRILSDTLNQNSSERRVIEEGSVENLVLQLDTSTVFQSQMMQATIHSLLNRQLWRRAWILQEICISNQAYIVCGDRRLCIDLFDAALATVVFCQEALYSVRNDLDECFPYESLLFSIQEPYNIDAREKLGRNLVCLPW